MTCGCGKGQTLIGGHALARQRKPGEAMRFRAQQIDAHMHVRMPTSHKRSISARDRPAPMRPA